MGLLPRVFRLVFGVAVLSVLISLPALRFDRNQGSVITPSIAWAGGSPDETLNPPPVPPPPQKVSAIRIGIGQASDAQAQRRSIRSFTALERWQLFYRVFRIFAYRY
jgi:hypothetical protein